MPVNGAGRGKDSAPRSAQIQLSPCYIFAGALALAMHCHLPLGIFIQVSTQRSWASTALPSLPVPLPRQTPVAIAVFPNAVTFMSLTSLVSHLLPFVMASVWALFAMVPSLFMLVKLSARSGATASGLLAFPAAAHCCSILAIAFSTPPPAILSLICAWTAIAIRTKVKHTSILFIESSSPDMDFQFV